MARSDDRAELFAKPATATWRKYEICRADFFQRKTAKGIAKQFGLQVGTVQSLGRDFAIDPGPGQFFLEKKPGRKTTPKRDAVIEQAVQWRQQGWTLEQITLHAKSPGTDISASYLAALRRRQGWGRSRSRRPPSRPGQRARAGSEAPPVADVHRVSLVPQRPIPTRVAGLFLFMPTLLALHVEQAIPTAGLPGTKPIPARNAIRALRAPKLLGKRRVSHLSDLALDEGESFANSSSMDSDMMSRRSA